VNLALINKTSSGLALQMVPHIGSTVDPAVGPCIIVATLADNGSSIQMIFQENEEQSKHHNERGCLVVKFEQRIVYREFVTLEPFEKAADKGQPVDNGWSRHFVLFLLNFVVKFIV